MNYTDIGYPVYVYEEGMELPEEGTYYVVAGNGNWLHKDTGIVGAFVKVGDISGLPDLDANAWVKCTLPKIPASITKKVKTFFKEVVDLYRTEASITLYFNKDAQTYKVHVPDQQVSHGGVHYDRLQVDELCEFDKSFEGYLRVGTIHSHCDFGAFHSGTDVGDEVDIDGVHCTFGHNDKERFTISASIVVNGNRMKVDPSTVLDGIERVEKKFKLFPSKHHDDETFQLSLEHEKEYNVDEWMESVRTYSMVRNQPPEEPRTTIQKGDYVEWKGNMENVPFKEHCGDGPFLVDSKTGDTVSIVTEFGLAQFSELLFKISDLEETTNEEDQKD